MSTLLGFCECICFEPLVGLDFNDSNDFNDFIDLSEGMDLCDLSLSRISTEIVDVVEIEEVFEAGVEIFVVVYVRGYGDGRSSCME